MPINTFSHSYFGRGISKVPDTSGVDLSSLPESYSELAKNNPYLNYDYTPTLWDKIGNFFGFGTGEDSFRTQMQIQAKLRDDQLLSTAREEEYNSPLQQVQRDSAAGLNSDLLGVSGSQASEFNEPENVPGVPDGTQELSNFAGNIMSLFSMTMGLASDIGQLSVLQNQIKAGQYENAGKLFNLARDAMFNTLDANGWFLDKESGTWKSGLSYQYDSEGNSWADKWSKDFALSRKDRESFKSMFDFIGMTLPSQVEAYKLWNEREKGRKSYAQQRASKYYSSNDSQMMEFISIITQNLEKLNEKEADLKMSQAENQQKFEDSIDRGAEASAINAENRKAGASATTEQEINNSWQSVVHELSKASEKGNRWAQIGLLVVAFLRAQSMPHYHSTQTSGYDSKGNYSEEKSSSFGF